MGKLAGSLPAQGRSKEGYDYIRNAINALGAEPGGVPAAPWRQARLELQLRQMEALYFLGRTDEMVQVADEVEPFLTKFGTTAQQLDFQYRTGSLLLRQKRYRLAPEEVKARFATLRHAERLDDPLYVTFLTFGLGFFLLLSDQAERAAETLTLGIRRAEAQGYWPVKNQCLVYLIIALRLEGDVDQVRSLQPESRELAEIVAAPYYIGAALANQAWLDYVDGCLTEAGTNARLALEHWPTTAYPFRWLAHWPLLALALDDGDLDTAVESAVAMLEPSQQLQSDEVTAVLEDAVGCWQQGEDESTRRALTEAVALAKASNHL